MKTMNVSAFRDNLTRAGALKGEAGVQMQKKAILETHAIIDDDGVMIDPETLDVTVVAPSVKSASGGAASCSQEALDEAVMKSVKGAFSKELYAHLNHANDKPGDNEWKNARTFGKLKNIKDKKTAYEFGTWIKATLGDQKSYKYCLDRGLIVKAHTEGVNSAGGFLVPDPFESELVSLREEYGVFRRNTYVKPMSSDTLRFSKRTAGLTAYWAGESIAPTESTQTFGSLQLTAKKMSITTTFSNELGEDALVSIADEIAGDMAYQFALKEDSAGFMGDGTSTHGGIVGLKTMCAGTYGAFDGGVTTYATVTKAMISKGIAALPQWATSGRGQVKIYCSKQQYHEIFETLAMAAGGVTAAEMSGGVSPRYFGYPVEITQAMDTAEADAVTYAFIGNLFLSSYMGDRRMVTVKYSDSALNAFEQDEVAVRGTERVDIISPNTGTASARGAMIQLTL